jgi:zinc protease
MKPGGDSILRTRLRNGLEVRLKEIHTAPLVSSWIWYRVGSRNERPGITGISHWVEHMQFKGTPEFPAGVLDRAISRDGGYWNAFTWIDWTAYFETMPADRIDLALRLEADRMVNSVFDPKEVASERTVIISEREGHENEPTFRLSEEMQAAAFRVHSYHHKVIGDMADLETITRDELYTHYRHYYNPANAVLVMAGDFKTRTMLEKVRRWFGPIEHGSRVQDAVRLEPPQRGERRVNVEGPGDTPYVGLAYHVPPAAEGAFLALNVLDSVLTGASSLNFFGSGISNKTSRMYQALVEGDLAASISGGLSATIDPYLYTIRATVRADRSPEDVLQRIDQEIEKILQAPLTREEVDKAITQAKALFAYDSESITNQAFWMGFSEMFAEYGWFETYLDRLAEAGPERILSAARSHLKPSNRVVGIYRPAEEAELG